MAVKQYEHFQVSANAAEQYERYPVRFILGPWAPSLIEAATLQAGQQVLDVACGTGVVTRLAAQQVQATGQVTGLDINPGMLAVARALPQPAGAPITWQEGSALALPFPDATFDAVLCQQGLQFFPDRPLAVREMHRVLKPGGRVALSVWRPLERNPFFSALAEALTRHISPEAGRGVPPAYTLGDAQELRALLLGTGLREVRIRINIRELRLPSVEEFLPRQLAAMPMAEAVAAAGEAAQAALVREMSTALQAYRDDEGVAVPMEAHIAVALK
jgi:ubiquinone/menaquinone biosynthesis C-methylase UbiE